MQKISYKKRADKPKDGRIKYEFDRIDVGGMMDSGKKYSNEAMRSMWTCIANYKKKPGNDKKEFSCRKTSGGNLGVWRDK